MDLLLDEKGNGTLVMRWPTKESYVRDQKAVLDPNHPAGICDAIAKISDEYSQTFWCQAKVM